MEKRLNLMQLLWIPFFIAVSCGYAQTRNIAPPVLQGDACASPDSNSFTVEAVLSPGDALPSDNEFILELSDANGSFDTIENVQELARADGPNNGTGIEQDIVFEDFAIPENVASDMYKLRVVSSVVPNLISELSEDTPMYFYRDDLSLILNDREDVIFCNVSSFSKTISVSLIDIDDDTVVDPADFSWEWYKDGALIIGESGSSITVSSEGVYYARIPLGACVNFFPFSRTNNVDVLLISVTDVTIGTDAPDFSYCPDEEKKLMSTETDLSYGYQWYKDGIALEGFISSTITLPDNDFGGVYTLEVNFSEDCVLTTAPVTVTNEGSSITVPLPEELILLPNQVINLEITTDAPLGSLIRWIVDTNIQSSGALADFTDAFDASFIATYRVEIDAIDPCDSELFSETEVVAPVSFEILIGTQDGVDCDQDMITLELLTMSGRTFDNRLVPLTEEQISFFDFEWYKDGVATGNTSSLLTISSDDESGSFELRADLKTGEFMNIVSNNVPIVFIEDNITLGKAPEFLIDNEPVTLTAPLNINYTYAWYRILDGEETRIEGEETNILVVQEEGNYFVRITSSLCSVDSLTTTIGPEGPLSGLIPNLVTPGGNSANDSWVLPSLYNQSDVKVTIYSASGKVDFEKSGGYSSDWPLNSISNASETLYYYIIQKNNSFIRKGTITVIR